MAEKEEGATSDECNSLVDRTGYLDSRIRVSLVFLCKNSTNLTEVVDLLVSQSLLSQRESETIENEKSNYDRFRQLFTFLIPKLRHGQNSQHFRDVFQQSGNEHILEKLNNADVNTNFDSRWVDTSSRSIRFNVREQVPSFFGRDNFLVDLDQQILNSHRAATDVPTSSTIISRVCVVTGLGGIGKTETIRKYIHGYGHFYQHVIWIDAEEHKTAENQFRKLALELQLSSKDIDGNAKEFNVILKEIYENLCTSSTLVVLDNAEALDDSDPQRHGVDRFLPTSLPLTHLKPVVLVTSRQLDWPDLHPMPLPLWTPQESGAFIFRQLKLKESEANTKDAETLSETFGGLPLALQAAAAVIIQESKRKEVLGKDVYTIQHLLSDYNQEKRKVLETCPPGSPDATPLMFLWKVSLDKIRQQPHGHLATQILNVMAHLSPTNIPKDLLFFIFNSNNEQSYAEAVELLVDYSFVHSSTHFSIHRVLQDVTVAHLETSTEEHPQNWLISLWTLPHLEAPTKENSKQRKLLLVTPPLTRITTALKRYWPTVPKSSEDYDAVHDNLVHVTMSHVLPKAQNPSETDLHFIEFVEFVLEEIKDTRWVEAEKCCRVLLFYFDSSAVPSQSASHFKSQNFKKVLFCRMRLAWILETMGRYMEAVDICQDTLSSLSSMENEEDVLPEILGTKSSLAKILMSQGDYEEAIKLYSSVTDLCSNLHGPTHEFTLNMKSNLAGALEKSGRLSEAKTLHAEILEVMMTNLGPVHLSTLSAKHNKALTLTDEGRYDDALEILRELTEVLERELGPLHAKTLVSNNCIANVLQKQGKDEGALQIFAEVISSYEKASAASHPDCLLAKSSVALILWKHGRLDEAKEMLCHVLDAREGLLGPSHKDTLTTKHSVATVLADQGKHAEALKLYEEVLELETKQLGPTHPSTLQTNYNIGWLHLKMGNFEKAEIILKEVLAARKETLPSDHPTIKKTEELCETARILKDFILVNDPSKSHLRK